MMNNPGGSHAPSGMSGHPGRRLQEYYYQPPPHLPHVPVPYGIPQYHGPHQNHHYPPSQWYAIPYQPYPQPGPRPYYQHPPPILPSYPNTPPTMPISRQSFHSPRPQSARTPVPESTSTASAATSDMLVSSSTTPTTGSVDTPAPVASKATSSLEQSLTPVTLPPSLRTPFFPPLPWFSVPESTFPPPRARRRRRVVQLTSNQLELPSRSIVAMSSPNADVPTTCGSSSSTGSTALDSLAMDQEQRTIMLEPKVTAPETSVVKTTADVGSSGDSDIKATEHTIPLVGAPNHLGEVAANAMATMPPANALHKRKDTLPIVPALPLPASRAPKSVASARPKETEKTMVNNANAVDSPVHDTDFAATIAPGTEREVAGVNESTATSSDASIVVMEKAAPKSWAELLRGKNATQDKTTLPASILDTYAPIRSQVVTVADAVRTYSVDNVNETPFLEPRGLINTGNMCYMNSILQVLTYCVPFYDFLDQIAKRAIHSFRSETPLIDSMIMFVREFAVLETASSRESLRARLRNEQLEKYGEAFIPEYVYDVIRRLPRFSSMRRGHQQDAEEFLGFLLEGLHDECVLVMRRDDSAAGMAELPGELHISAPGSEEKGWLEVGPKQKAAMTRDSGTIVLESPITRIFGGKLRSEFRVPGLKNSVTLEPYQPLQLDIGSPQVYNITDAMKGITRSEVIQGDFNSPRGPGQIATKQVFIETLPPVLILHLKRFQYDNTGGTQKIWRKVGYPLELEIPKEMFAPHKRSAYGISGLPKYRLISVVYHHGKNASGGHYTVDVRRQEGQEWIRLDDTLIRRVKSEDVAAEGAEEDSKVLASVLENHGRDDEKDAVKAAGFEVLDQEHDEEDRGAWSQVNGFSSPPSKKWSGVVGATSNGSTAAAQPASKNTKFSVKDNKVAYILFYQRI